MSWLQQWRGSGQPHPDRRVGDGQPSYAPSFFTEAEWKILTAAVDRLIPPDEHGPGACEAGVPEYIDRQMELPFGHGAWFYTQGPFHPEAAAQFGYQNPQTPRELYREGLAGLEAAAMAAYKMSFAEVDAAAQDALLQRAEKGDDALGPWPARAFFARLLQNTREGYFADPAYGGNRGMGGWRMIGFPGARGDFTDWIDRPGAPYPYGPVSLDGKAG